VEQYRWFSIPQGSAAAVLQCSVPEPAESEPPKLPPHVESAAYEIVTFDFLSIPTIKEEPVTPVLAPVSNQNGEVLSRTNPPVEEPENPKPIEDPEDPEGPGHDENPEELPTSPE